MGVQASDGASHSNSLARVRESLSSINWRHPSAANTTKPIPQPRPFQKSRNSEQKGLFLQADVADDAQVARVIQRTVEHFGGLDILVNNAGIHIPGGVQELSIADWDSVVGVNLRGVFVATKLAIPHLKQSKFGRIIQIASVHAYGGGAGPAYAPAKAAVVSMVRDTALEIGQFGITVNAICPGYVETAIQDYLTREQIEEALEKTALPRFGLPRDIGRAAIFLASDDAEWITGASLLVDGGFAAGV